MKLMRAIYSGAAVRRNLQAHKILGLTVAALLYLICLSGTVTVFFDAMERWETAAVPDVTHATSRAIATAVTDARAHAPTPDIAVAAALPTMESPRLIVTLSEDHRAYDARGRYVGPANHPIVEGLTELHYYLHLPGTIGLILVGLGGLVMVSLIVGGILAHPRIFKDAFLWRWTSGARLARTDLHNRIGVWGAPFHMVIAVTGALIGLGNVFILTVALAFHGGDVARAADPLLGPAAVAVRDGRVTSDAIVRALDTAAAHGVPSYLIINNPGTDKESISITTDVPDWLGYGETHEFDRRGKLVAAHHMLDGPMGKQVYAGLYKLHFGSFGGLWVQWAYMLLGLGLCLVCTTGVDIWLLKSAQRGRDRPRLRAAWRCFVWGAPCAMVIAAILTLLTGLVFKPIFWTVLAGATLAGGYSAKPIACWCRYALGIGLLLLTAAHGIRFGAHALSGAALSVNATLLVIGLVVLLARNPSLHSQPGSMEPVSTKR